MRPLHAALLLLAPLLVFAGALDNAYHLDDWYRVFQNQEVERLAPMGRHFVDPSTIASLPRIVQYRPLLPLSLSLSYALAGDHSKIAYHAGNLLFHLAAVLLLYLLVRALLLRARPDGDRRGAERLALAPALLFAIHPVSGVPVNYVCARDLLMMQAFLTGSLLVYVQLRQRGGGAARWGAALVLLALSILSKTNAAAAPLVVLAYELCFERGSLLRPRTWARVAPFGAVVAGYFAFTRFVLGFSDVDQLLVPRSSVLEYPLTELKVHLFYYLRNVLWPFHMRPLPAIEAVRSLADPAALAGLALVAGSLVWAWRQRRRSPLAAFCVLAYWLLFSPTSSVIPFRSFAADYRGYPSLPFALLLGCLGAQRALTPRGRKAALALACAWLAAGSLWQNDVWQSEESLWGHSARRGGTVVARLNYSQALAGRDDERAQALLEEVLAEMPDYIVAHLNLGWLHVRHGRHEQGLAHMQQGVALGPGIAQSHYWYAKGLREAQRPAEAVSAARRAMQLDPGNRRYVVQAALCEQVNGNDEGCLALLAELHRDWPHHEGSRFVEGWSFQRSGRLAEAIASYLVLLEHEPEHVQGRFNLAYALMEEGRHEEAVRQFEQVLRRAPERVEVHAHLATCLRALGDEDGASEQDRLYREGSG